SLPCCWACFRRRLLRLLQLLVHLGRAGLGLLQGGTPWSPSAARAGAGRGRPAPAGEWRAGTTRHACSSSVTSRWTCVEGLRISPVQDLARRGGRADAESTAKDGPLFVQRHYQAAGSYQRPSHQELLDGRPRQGYLRNQDAGGQTHLERVAARVAYPTPQ